MKDSRGIELDKECHTKAAAEHQKWSVHDADFWNQYTLPCTAAMRRNQQEQFMLGGGTMHFTKMRKGMEGMPPQDTSWSKNI